MKNVLIKVPDQKIPLIKDAAVICGHLKLLPHPEGGWFREVYRSDEILSTGALPGRYKEAHNVSTSIYFLLESNDFSAFHRIRSDETWHFYKGSPVKLYIITTEGKLLDVILGNNLNDGQLLQFTITRNCWFAAKVVEENSYSLVGCTVAPGFEFADFELGKRHQLEELFPHMQQLINEFTRF